MRQWGVNPKILCKKHLLGEHVEQHMFVGSINKGISLDGYVRGGLVEVHNIRARHDLLVEEMARRGMHHNSELPEFESWEAGSIDWRSALRDLTARCPHCFRRAAKINAKGEPYYDSLHDEGSQALAAEDGAV